MSEKISLDSSDILPYLLCFFIKVQRCEPASALASELPVNRESAKG